MVFTNHRAAASASKAVSGATAVMHHLGDGLVQGVFDGLDADEALDRGLPDPFEGSVEGAVVLRSRWSVRPGHVPELGDHLRRTGLAHLRLVRAR